MRTLNPLPLFLGSSMRFGDVDEDMQKEIVRILGGPPSIRNFHLACLLSMTFLLGASRLDLLVF